MASDARSRHQGMKGTISLLYAVALIASPALTAHAAWSTRTAVDDRTGEQLMIASVYAHQTDSGDPKRKALHVRCKDGNINLYVEWGHAIDEDFGLQARFDRLKPMDLPITVAADPGTAYVRLNETVRGRLLHLLKKSDNLTVRLYDWPGRPVQGQFSLTGSNRAIGQVERSCMAARQQKERAIADKAAHYETQYRAELGAAVRRNWIRPQSAQMEVTCGVRVKTFPDGEVISAEVIDSCGSTALDQSVIDAIYQSSPLPAPRYWSLFARGITFEFSSR